ncbi:MAG: hypothetical protein OHK0012_05120 [Synechococcales cyanobacterium]
MRSPCAAPQILRATTPLLIMAALVAGCNSPMTTAPLPLTDTPPTTTPSDSDPTDSGSTDAGASDPSATTSGTVTGETLTLAQQVRVSLAGQVRLNISNVVGTLPASIQIQEATFLLFDDGTTSFYAAALESAFTGPMQPFQSISVPGVQSATVEVIVLPLTSSDGDATVEGSRVFQNNGRQVTLQDVALMMALHQLRGRPTAEQLATQASSLLRTPIAAESINPVPNRTNADYAAPAKTFNLVDVALMQAAYYLLPVDRTTSRLTAVTNQLLKRTVTLTPGDILKIPGVGVIPDYVPGIPFSPPVGRYVAGQLAFSVVGEHEATSFPIAGEAGEVAHFIRLNTPSFPGYTTYVANPASAFIFLPAFQSLPLPGLINQGCVIIHEPTKDPSQVSHWIASSTTCHDPRLPDLVVANSGQHSVMSFANRGNSNNPRYLFQAHHATGQYPNALATVDLNLDGKLDVLTTNATSNSLSVLMGQGDERFQSPMSYPLSSTPRGLVVGNFYSDNLPSVVVIGSNKLYPFGGNGNGSLAAGPEITVTNPNGIAAGDFNGDGFDDVVISNTMNAGTASVLINRGGSRFESTPHSVGPQPTSVAVGDVNNDNHLDVAVALNGSNAIAVLLGNGDGTFQSRLLAITPVQPNRIAMADLNNDGRLDVVATHTNSPQLTILPGNGDGTFQAFITRDNQSVPRSLTLADMNQDGFIDVITTGAASSTAGVARIWFGAVNFQSYVASDVDTAAYPNAVGVGQF